jgi:transposase
MRLITATYPNKYVKSVDTAAFARLLPRALGGPAIVIWDRGTMHRGDPIRAMLRRCSRLATEFLPPYAPELNPAEALWNHVKADVLANLTPKTTAELLRHLNPLLDQIRHDQRRLRSFLAASPLFGEGGYIT